MTKQNSPAAQEHTLRVKTTAGMATLLLAQQGRKFLVKSFLADDAPDRSLGFSPQGPGVEDLDAGKSDASQCFNISTHVRVDGNVTLSVHEMKASCIEELRSALKKVKLRAWNREEI